MIRNSPGEIFRWLLISRCDISHGSGISLRPGVMRVINGNIGAARAFVIAVAFSPQGLELKEDARSSSQRRMNLPFGRLSSVPNPLLVYCKTKFTCNLNNMRSYHGSPDWLCSPGFRG